MKHLPPKDLREFLTSLSKRNDVIEIDSLVDPYLELAEIHRRVIKAQGPALLFKNVKGSRFPVVTNLFGTKARVDLAFGERPQEIVAEIAKLPHEMLPPTIGKFWQKRSLLFDLLKVGTRRKNTAPVLDLVQTPPALERLPLITTWKEDGGPFFTLPLVYTEHPELRTPNLGMYRMQRFDNTRTGLHMQIGKGGGYHLHRYGELGRKMPVNVFLGGPPAMILAAIAPLPENVPEVLLASLVLGQKLPLARHSESPLPLLADAEFVLVGEVDPTERHPEGPFGDHYGYYSLKHDYPVFHCKKLFHRHDAIYPATVVGKPRQEDFFIGDYLQELLSPLFPLVMPTVRDLWSYGETGFHSLAAASVRERYGREALVSAFRILGEGQLALTKFLLVLDGALNLRNFREVFEYVLERADFRRDLYIFSNLSMDTLDYTGPKVNEGSKGTLVGVGEPIRALPREFHGQLPNGSTGAKVFCGGCLVVSGPKFSAEPNFAAQVVDTDSFSQWPVIILTEDLTIADEESKFLWSVFTRFEPAADIYARETKLIRHHPSYSLPIVIDARMKPSYPEELECDPETAELVSKKWSSYGIRL